MKKKSRRSIVSGFLLASVFLNTFVFKTAWENLYETETATNDHFAEEDERPNMSGYHDNNSNVEDHPKNLIGSCLDDIYRKQMQRKSKFNNKLSAQMSTDTPQLIDCSLYQHLDTRIIYFLHIHKSGGTSFCASAKANYFLSNYSMNCNIFERCCGGNSLQAHQDFAKTTPYQFVANEWPMHDVMDKENYRYVVQLRNSESRYKSHYKVKYRVDKFLDWLDGQPDNFNLRMICGTHCLHRPKFQLTREDFLLSLDRLSKFDNIVLLEDFDQTFTKFASQVGWLSYAGVRNVGRFSSRTISQSIDQSYTALDDALYEFGAARLENNNRVQASNFTYSPSIYRGIEEYFKSTLGLDQNCVTPCCRDCLFDFNWGKRMNNLLTNRTL